MLDNVGKNHLQNENPIKNKMVTIGTHKSMGCFQLHSANTAHNESNRNSILWFYFSVKALKGITLNKMSPVGIQKKRHQQFRAFYCSILFKSILYVNSNNYTCKKNVRGKIKINIESCNRTTTLFCKGKRIYLCSILEK